MALYILLSLLASLALSQPTASIPSNTDTEPPQSFDPNNDTAVSSHGTIVSPERIVLRLDCPGCPVFEGEDRIENITSLLYDFAIVRPRPSRFLGQYEGSHKITLNKRTLFPQEDPESTPLVSAAAVPLSSGESISSYLHRPDRFPEAGLLGSLRPSRVDNPYGLNMLCLTLRTTFYGDEHMQGLDNEDDEISLIQIYIRKTPRATSTRGRSGMATTVKITYWHWTLDWWEIVPRNELISRASTLDGADSTVKLPKGLVSKLIAERVISPPGQPAVKPLPIPAQKIGPCNVIQVWAMAAVTVLGMLALGYIGTLACREVRRVVVYHLVEEPKRGVLNLDDYAFLSESAICKSAENGGCGA